MELAWLEAERRGEVWRLITSMPEGGEIMGARELLGERVCVGRGTDESPTWETNEDVILARNKCIETFPLIIQSSVSQYELFSPFSHIWLLLGILTYLSLVVSLPLQIAFQKKTI